RVEQSLIIRERSLNSNSKISRPTRMSRPAAARVASRSPALDQKEKLIAATERLLSSQGLGCVTTRDIARAAKVAEGALYHHFGDKRSEEHTSELQSRVELVCRLLLETKTG